MSEEGSEDSPPRPKRKIKKVVVISSDSSSDSDEGVVATGTRRKRLRVLSDEGSDSSGSSVVCIGTHRKRALPKLRDSDADSDTSGWGTDHSDASKPTTSTAKPTSGFASDSSEGNSDKCSICLLRFTNQEVGTPQSCEHIFCLDCITEWSKNVNTCPVDRMSFDFIVVRACAGGRVLRTEPVKVIERRPSVELFVIEDATMCEVCGQTNSEETMLLCDGCDLGYHMACLTPRLEEVPVDQWLCPNCDGLLADVDILFSGLDAEMDMALEARHLPVRELRSAHSHRNSSYSDEPSTSSGHRGSQLNSDNNPTTSRGTSMSHSTRSRNGTTRRKPNTQRRRHKRRRTKTVLIEYEIQENGKFPVTKTVRRKMKKRKARGRREPRTAARRSHVRASVRARLQAAGAAPGGAPAAGAGLAARRLHAGTAPLSLFGARAQLDYFSDDDELGAPGAGPALAVRPTSAILSAYRQARRKMISIPSPPPASSASDVLSSILESQTLLHSKKSVLSIAVDGRVNIKVETREKTKLPKSTSQERERIDVSKGEDASRKVPSYPGQSRGGGWGGGYRGSYPRDQGTGFNGRGGGYDNSYNSGYQNRQGNSNAFHQNNNMRRDDGDAYDNFPRRPHQYPLGDELGFERRRQADAERGAGGAPPGRYSLGSWPRPAPADDPLDMRVAPPASPPAAAPYRPLPEPPVFKFEKTPEADKSEDERSDSGLVIDTDKYDPTEPTHDDEDSGAEEAAAPPGPPAASGAPPSASTPAGAALSAPPAVLAGLQGVPADVLQGVPAGVLHSAVRAALHEHRALLAPAERSDDEPDGDCPNFSIYSAASVHLAAGAAPAPAPPAPPAPDPLEDLVQEDDEPEPPRRADRDLKEKVSKRCPITADPRDPIKIKLNAPSLIKRQMTLYDEEETEDDAEVAVEPAGAAAPAEDWPGPPEICREEEPGPPDVDEEPTPKQDEDKEMDSASERGGEDATPERVPSAPGTPRHAPPAAGADRPVPAGLTPERDAAVPRSGDDSASDDERDDLSGTEDNELPADSQSPAKEPPERPDDALEKMTESISETEDERSYTPCLDENKSKDTSLSTDRDKALEGLDTEMISEDEGNGLFSDHERASPPAASPPAPAEDGEILDRKKDTPDPKKKKKKDSKKEGKEKAKLKSKKGEIAFKKLSKSGKERNYRERDKDKGKRDSSAGGERERGKRRKERRQDLERYDVRTLLSERRRRPKDAFGRDVSPRNRDSSPRVRDVSPRVRDGSPRARDTSPRGRDTSPRAPSVASSRSSRATPPRSAPAAPSPRRRRSPAAPSPRRRRGPERARKRRRSASASPRPKPGKRKKRARSSRSGSRRRSPRRRSARRRARRRSASRSVRAPSAPRARSGGSRGSRSVDSRLLSPRTPPPEPSPPPAEPPRRRRRAAGQARHRRARDAPGPSKEVFTSGDNILVSVSFKDQERPEGEDRRERRRERRRRRRRAAVPEPDVVAAKPVAIIDLERSPFRELTPSPRDVIVLLSDDEAVEKEAPGPPAPSAAAAPEPAAAAVGPKTPPEPAAAPEVAPSAEEARGPLTPPEPPDSPDAYDPYEPTRSASASPHSAQTSPPRALMTLETAQKTNMSADDVIDRRPLSPIEKVMALLQSTRDVPPEEPQAGSSAPGGSPAAAPAPAVRIVLPSPTRPAPPKLFLAKPSPIKSDPIKPMPATKLPRPAPARAEPDGSPYSPGSSDFGDLFEPRDAFDAALQRPQRRKRRRNKGRADGKDDDKLKGLEELPGSAVELQLKTKFLKKLNRQERVVEEVKLVLKPHYNKKRVSKDEYKDILRRAVPKICHNKSGEINPAKIQALVEAYVKKFRKKHKLGLI